MALQLSETSKIPQRVTVTTAPGTAIYGVDYFFAPLRQAILFAPGQISQTFTVSILKDSITEPGETFTVHATPDDQAIASRSRGVTIVDSGGSTSSNSNFQITFFRRLNCHGID